MGKYFVATDLLLPKTDSMEAWAVIACDQFTSDKAYWKRVRQTAEGKLSTLHMILPEAELSTSTDTTIDEINACMRKYLADNVFTEYKDAFVYIERTLVDGSIRQGVIGAVDLEHYHYDPTKHPMISATEMTVLERIPPRVAVRKDAQLEFSHVLMLCEDPEYLLIEKVAEKKAQLPKLYEFDLMEGGGHIAAWLVQGQDAADFADALSEYESRNTYMVGDGNHSLVTAMTIYEQLKQENPEAASNHPSRFAMVELENVHSPAMAFEPIHRVLTEVDAAKLLKDMESICCADGVPVRWFAGEESGTVYINTPKGELTVGILQDFLDAWMKENTAEIDYIHGDDAVEQLGRAQNAIGLLLPGMSKSDLFPFVQGGRTLPRKTFSMGHGCEKRYYLEGRKIK